MIALDGDFFIQNVSLIVMLIIGQIYLGLCLRKTVLTLLQVLLYGSYLLFAYLFELFDHDCFADGLYLCLQRREVVIGKGILIVKVSMKMCQVRNDGLIPHFGLRDEDVVNEIE